MADEGVKFSSGMQHIANPSATARVMIDVDGASEPQYAELQDLKEGTGIAQLGRKSPVYNVTYEVPPPLLGYYTPDQAREAVPGEIRKPGLIITYQTGANEWVTEQYTSNATVGWADSINWKSIGSDSNEFDEYGTFPDEETGNIDFITFNAPGYVVFPAAVGTNSGSDRYVNDKNYRMFGYPIIPGRTYEVSFYAKLATSVGTRPGIFYGGQGRSVYNVPNDLPSATLQTFSFTASKDENLLVVCAITTMAMPVVNGAKSRYYRYLDGDTMELKPVLANHPSFNYMDMGTLMNQNNGLPYHTPTNPITISWGQNDQYQGFIYKILKGKVYSFLTANVGVWRPIMAVIPESDLVSIMGYQENGTKRQLPNTKWEDAFFNDQNYITSRSGFKDYLCKEDNMYFVVSGNRSQFNSFKLTESEPAVISPRVFQYNDYDIQKYVPYNNYGRINIIGTLPTSKSQGDIPCDAEIRIAGYNMTTKVKVSIQGTSTATFPKKGFTLDLLTPDGADSMKIQIGAWREYDSYYMKAYMYDVTKTRDTLANRVFEQMKLSLPKGRQRNWERSGLTFNYPVGAIGHIDGIPFDLYNNGTFYGIYVLNIKKTRDNYMMSKSNQDQIWLDVGLTALGGSSVPWNVIEIRNPGGFDEGAEPPAGSVKTAITEYWNWQAASNWPSRQKNEIESRLDIVSVIDTYLLHMLIHAWDGNSNNMFFSTYNNGGKWSYEIYDFNDTWGKSFIGINDVYNDVTFGTQPKRADFDRIRALYFEEIRYRWKMLYDAGVMTWENISSMMYQFYNQYGSDGMNRDLKKWNLANEAGVTTAGLIQMERYIKVAMHSLNNAFDVFELRSPIIETDMFK